MGRVVYGPSDSSKQALTADTQAAATIVIAPGDAGVFVGTNVETKRVTGLTRMLQCLDIAREAGWPFGDAFNIASVSADGHKGRVAISDANLAIPPLTEDDIAVLWTDTFETGAEAKSLIFDTFIQRCMDRLKEELVAV